MAAWGRSTRRRCDVARAQQTGVAVRADHVVHCVRSLRPCGGRFGCVRARRTAANRPRGSKGTATGAALGAVVAFLAAAPVTVDSGPHRAFLCAGPEQPGSPQHEYGSTICRVHATEHIGKQ